MRTGEPLLRRKRRGHDARSFLALLATESSSSCFIAFRHLCGERLRAGRRGALHRETRPSVGRDSIYAVLAGGEFLYDTQETFEFRIAPSSRLSIRHRILIVMAVVLDMIE